MRKQGEHGQKKPRCFCISRRNNDMAKKTIKKKPKPTTKRALKKVSAKDLKQARLGELIISGMDATQAMLQAGYSETTAQKQQSRTVGNSRVQEILAESLAEKMCNIQRVATKLDEHLEAQKEISFIFNKIKKQYGIAIDKESGVSEQKDADELSMDFISVPDYVAQDKALEKLIKLLDLYPKKTTTTEFDFEAVERRLDKAQEIYEAKRKGIKIRIVREE